LLEGTRSLSRSRHTRRLYQRAVRKWLRMRYERIKSWLSGSDNCGRDWD